MNKPAQGRNLRGPRSSVALHYRASTILTLTTRPSIADDRFTVSRTLPSGAAPHRSRASPDHVSVGPGDLPLVGAPSTRALMPTVLQHTPQRIQLLCLRST